ncbi:hypothetical protein BDW02DRAFT_620147 [Decorospora gaudefroyi]|uniref:Uncharacterized protein n=1 Tax=Decorospora gaudefroyi TaxID=184978 RepID=A0A6A5KP06_9PLEO|nr:hypothetical protein BDW02DRAFT_620147 [Decorospora gaudefroyi]
MLSALMRLCLAHFFSTILHVSPTVVRNAYHANCLTIFNLMATYLPPGINAADIIGLGTTGFAALIPNSRRVIKARRLRPMRSRSQGLRATNTFAWELEYNDTALLRQRRAWDYFGVC